METIRDSEIVKGLRVEWGGCGAVPEQLEVGRTYINKTFDLLWHGSNSGPPEGQGRPNSELVRSDDGKVLWNHD